MTTPYAQQDRTPEQAAMDRLVTSDQYIAGVDFGYRLALAKYGIPEEDA